MAQGAGFSISSIFTFTQLGVSHPSGLQTGGSEYGEQAEPPSPPFFLREGLQLLEVVSHGYSLTSTGQKLSKTRLEYSINLEENFWHLRASRAEGYIKLQPWR